MSTAITPTSAVRELTTLCKTGRQAYLEAVQQRDEMEAAMIRADALLRAIDAANTEHAAAALLRMAHPDAGMVEVVGEGTNRETVRVMAMALFCGFTPGRQEFAIFHGRVKSALYLKDAGIRKLLVQMGCEPPQVSVGFPVQQQVKNGPIVWVVEGEASTVFHGQTYRVQFSGAGAVKLPCKLYKNSSDSSDNIDGIIAKARRRMLLELMRVVQSAAGMVPDHDEASDEADGSTIDTRLEVIDAAPVPSQSPLETYLRDLPAEVAAYVRNLHSLLTTSETVEQLDEVATQFKAAADEHRLSERIKGEMRRAYTQRKGELSGQ